MKKISILAVLATSAAAHSGVSSVTFDGTIYPARDARFDPYFGSKRVEWKYKDMNSVPMMAVTDVLDPAITCGLDAQSPELKAVARAGSNVTVQWTGIVKMHLGPVMSYLGPWSPGMKLQDVQFFKVSEVGFDKKRHAWGNEDLIQQDHSETFQLPSDIKPGLYVFRTELLALHGNMWSSSPTLYSGPQFYPHCFNVEITGNGNVVPKGVTFPGGYKRDDPGVAFRLYPDEKAWDNYIIPGPPVYRGRYESPVGPKPVVEPKDAGAFPPEFEAKVAAHKKKEDDWAKDAMKVFNTMDPGGKYPPTLNAYSLEMYAKHGPPAMSKLWDLIVEVQELRAEAIKLGLVTP